MNLLRRLFFNLFVISTSFCIVFFSIAFVLPNSDTHRAQLIENNVYDKMATQLRTQSSTDKSIIKKGFSYILSNTIISENVTPIWLRGVTEKNINLTSNWLVGTGNWDFYFPTRDVEIALQKGVDAQTQSFIDDNKKEIKVCTEQQSMDVQSSGYNLSKEFCIPSEVRNGQKSITEFTSNNSLVPTTGILNRLVADSKISTSSEVQPVSEALPEISNSKGLMGVNFLSVRDFTLFFRQNVLGILFILIGILLVNLWFISVGKRRFIYFAIKSSFLISLFSMLISISIIIFVGGTKFVPTLLKDIFLPGFLNEEIIKIVSENVVVFVTRLITPGLFGSLLFLCIGSVAYLLNRFDILVPAKYKDKVGEKSKLYKNFFSHSLGRTGHSKDKHTKKLELLKTYQPGPDPLTNLSLTSAQDVNGSFQNFDLGGSSNKKALNILDSDKKSEIVPIKKQNTRKIQF